MAAVQLDAVARAMTDLEATEVGNKAHDALFRAIDEVPAVVA